MTYRPQTMKQAMARAKRSTQPRARFAHWLDKCLKVKPASPEAEAQHAHDIEAVAAMRLHIKARHAAGFTATRGTWEMSR